MRQLAEDLETQQLQCEQAEKKEVQGALGADRDKDRDTCASLPDARELSADAARARRRTLRRLRRCGLVSDWRMELADSMAAWRQREGLAHAAC